MKFSYLVLGAMVMTFISYTAYANRCFSHTCTKGEVVARTVGGVTTVGCTQGGTLIIREVACRPAQ